MGFQLGLGGWDPGSNPSGGVSLLQMTEVQFFIAYETPISTPIRQQAKATGLPAPLHINEPSVSGLITSFGSINSLLRTFSKPLP